MPPPPPNSVNARRTGHFKEFLLLLVALAGGFGLLLAAVFLVGQWLGPMVPFAWEKRLGGAVSAELGTEGSGQIRTELEQRAATLVRVMDLPEPVSVTVHYDRGRTVNAFATFGGNIVVFRGLIDAMPDDRALDFVLAHEIAHVRHRDVMRAIGGRALLGIALSLLFGDTGLVGSLVGGASELGALSYGRSREAAADRAALEALCRLYGDGRGFTGAFQALSEAHGETFVPALLSTHPDPQARIEALRVYAGRLDCPVSG
ncbi:MAG: M48 family metallopeptidase [Geminicoccaceae bacterium]